MVSAERVNGAMKALTDTPRFRNAASVLDYVDQVDSPHNGTQNNHRAALRSLVAIDNKLSDTLKTY